MAKEFEQITWNEQLEDDCRQIVRLAIREDLDRHCDWTTVSLVPAMARGSADIVAREAGVVAGLHAMNIAIDEIQANVQVESLKHDGDAVAQGTRIARLTGSVRDLLTSERVILNLIGRLSGIATLTRQYVDQIVGTAARVYDTRKTTPGWRRLEKHAVRMGGGTNHRVGLFAAVMIKDNHLAHGAQQGMTSADAVRQTRDFLAAAGVGAEMILEIEVDTLEQLRDVLPSKPDIVLLDNMSPHQLSACVALRNATAPDVQLEASGGVTLTSIREIARSGVERISVGALTHSAVNFDVGLDWT